LEVKGYLPCIHCSSCRNLLVQKTIDPAAERHTPVNRSRSERTRPTRHFGNREWSKALDRQTPPARWQVHPRCYSPNGYWRAGASPIDPLASPFDSRGRPWNAPAAFFPTKVNGPTFVNELSCKHGPRLGAHALECVMGENEILQSGTAPGPNKEFASGQKVRARREPRKAIKKTV